MIDADGLNFLAKFPPPLRGKAREGGLKKIPRNLILTPHPKEMSRLIGANVDEILKPKSEEEKAKESQEEIKRKFMERMNILNHRFGKED